MKACPHVFSIVLRVACRPVTTSMEPASSASVDVEIWLSLFHVRVTTANA